jgi:glycosyl transferase family 25
MYLQNYHKDIALLNSFFDKILVINIARNADRRKYVYDNIEGLDFDFFDGVDGRMFTGQSHVEGVDNEGCLQTSGKILKLGEIGCAMSHKKVWEHIVEKGYKKTLILEDDAMFLVEHIRCISAILDTMPQDWEMIYWGYVNDAVPLLSTYVKINYLYPFIRKFRPNFNPNLDVIGRKYSTYHSQFFRKAGFHGGTHAYAVTLETAKKYITLSSPIIGTAEYPLQQHSITPNSKTFITVPAIFGQRQGIISSIHHT